MILICVSNICLWFLLVSFLLYGMTVAVVLYNWCAQMLNEMYANFQPYGYMELSLFLLALSFIWFNLGIYKKGKKTKANKDKKYYYKYIFLITILYVIVPVIADILILMYDFDDAFKLMMIHVVGLIVFIGLYFYLGWLKGVFIYVPVSTYFLIYHFSVLEYSGTLGFGIYFVFGIAVVSLFECGIMIMLNKRKWDITPHSADTENELFLGKFLTRERLLNDIDELSTRKCIVPLILWLVLSLLAVYVTVEDKIPYGQLGLVVSLLLMVLAFREYYLFCRASFAKCDCARKQKGMLYLPLVLMIISWIFKNVFYDKISGLNNPSELVLGGLLAAGILCLVLLYKNGIFIWFPVSFFYIFCWSGMKTVGGFLGLYVELAPVIFITIEYGLTLILNTDYERNEEITQQNDT